MFDRFFAVDFAKVIRWNTPPDQAAKALSPGFPVLSLFKATAGGFLHVQELFNAFRSRTRYELKFSGQKVYMQHYLNDQFDPEARGIVIENQDFVNPEYRYNQLEDRPRFRYNAAEGVLTYRRNQAELEDEPRFSVVVPANLPLTDFLKIRIAEAVDKFNNVITKYNIIQAP